MKSELNSITHTQ